MRILRQRVKVLSTYRRRRQNIEYDKTGDDKSSRDDVRPVPSSAFGRVLHKLCDLPCGSGIDYLAWPVNSVGLYIRLVGAGRFELPTSWSQTRRPAAGPRPVRWVKKWLTDGCGKPKSRWYPRRGSNSHLWLRRPALYPLSYGDTLFGC